jgi:hypothetical protein
MVGLGLGLIGCVGGIGAIAPTPTLSTNANRGVASEMSSVPGGLQHDARLDGGVTREKDLPTMVAMAMRPDRDPVRWDRPAGPATTCSVGTVRLDARACSGPMRYLGTVVRYGAEADIDPRLVMIILLNESHHLPGAGSLLQQGIALVDAELSVGIADMKQRAFNRARQQAGGRLADRTWRELSSHPSLAIEAAAWYLRYLEAHLLSAWVADYARDEMLAVGYNGGDVNMNRIAGSPPNGTPPTPEQVDPHWHLSWYLNSVRSQWDHVDHVICGSGAFRCLG